MPILRWPAIAFVAIIVALATLGTPTPIQAAHINPALASTIIIGPESGQVGRVAVDEAANKIYVSRRQAATIAVIDGATDVIEDEIPLLSSPVAVAVNPTLGHLYVLRTGVNLLHVYDTSTRSLIGTVPTGLTPSLMAINEALDTVYVANTGSGTISIIRADTLTNVNSLPVANPTWIAANPVTGKVYVKKLFASNELTVITDYGLDTTFGLEAVAYPFWMDWVFVNPQTNRIYADGWRVEVIDGATMEHLETLPYASGGVNNPEAGVVYAYHNSDLFVLDAVSHAVIATVVAGLPEAVNTATGLLYNVTKSSNTAYLRIYDDDGDLDGVGNHGDNCPTDANPGQEDTDGDGAGDACDPDDDGDGVADGSDNCPLVANAGQENVVHPATTEGDTCEDPDADGVADVTDNCPDDANASQSDNDGDGAGDACDPDDDNDTVADTTDNCPFISNATQDDVDWDGPGDVCDNCPSTPNANQADLDGDQIGNVCDDDIDGDGLPNGDDPDADADLVSNVAEGPCGGDPFDPSKWPERTSGLFNGVDDDGDGEIDEALPAGAGAYDCDGDGYIGTTEAYIYQGHLAVDQDQVGCGSKWPSDLVGQLSGSMNRVTIADLTSFVAPYRYLGKNIGQGGSWRHDLSPGSNGLPFDINVLDLAALVAGPSGYPPMFNGARAFNGPMGRC